MSVREGKAGEGGAPIYEWRVVLPAWGRDEGVRLLGVNKKVPLGSEGSEIETRGKIWFGFLCGFALLGSLPWNLRSSPRACFMVPLNESVPERIGQSRGTFFTEGMLHCPENQHGTSAGFFTREALHLRLRHHFVDLRQL